MNKPNIIAFSRGFHKRDINGNNVVNKDYNLKINPNKVILETRENDKNYEKKYDSPNSFIKTFIEKQSLFDMIRHDDNLVKPRKITRRYRKLYKGLKVKKRGTRGKTRGTRGKRYKTREKRRVQDRK